MQILEQTEMKLKHPFARLELERIAGYLSGSEGTPTPHLVEDCINDLAIYDESPIGDFIGDTLYSEAEAEGLARLEEAINGLLERTGSAGFSARQLSDPQFGKIAEAARSLRLILDRGNRVERMHSD